MLRKFVCAAVVLVLSLGVASGEMLKGKITKIDSKSVTFQVKGQDAKTYDLDSNVKVMKTVKKNKTEEVADGLKAEALQKISDKGLNATLTIDDTSKKVTEITLGGGKKKKDN